MKVAILTLAMTAWTCHAFVVVAPRLVQPKAFVHVGKLRMSEETVEAHPVALEQEQHQEQARVEEHSSSTATDAGSVHIAQSPKAEEAVAEAPVKLVASDESKHDAVVETPTASTTTTTASTEAPATTAASEPEKIVVAQESTPAAPPKEQVVEPVHAKEETLVAEAPKPATTSSTAEADSAHPIVAEKKETLVAEATAVPANIKNDIHPEEITAKMEKALSSTTETMASSNADGLQKEIVAKVSSSTTASDDVLQPSMDKLAQILEASSTGAVSKQEILGKVSDIIGELNSVLDHL